MRYQLFNLVRGTRNLFIRRIYNCNSIRIINPQLPLIHCQRSFVLSNVKSCAATEAKSVEPVLSFWQKLLVRSKISNRDKYRIRYTGHVLYCDIRDNLDCLAFFKVFKMADTFFSWFLVTELHVWMVMVRFMAEGESGDSARYYLVEAFWEDVSRRINQLGPINASVKKKELTLLYQQFNAAIIGYDEGILSDDKILASALWRRFFKLECNNPEDLEKLVIYVRKQTMLLDQISSKEILFNRAGIKWLDIRDVGCEL